MGFVSMRVYIMVGIVVGLVAGLVAWLLGPGIATWVVEQRGLAFPSIGVLADVIAQPIIWVMTNPALGGLVAGLAWPLALIEVALLFLLSLIGLGGSAAGEVGGKL